MTKLTNKVIEGIERACERLIVDFASAVDERDYAATVDVFTEDADFIRPDSSVKGKKQISELLNARPETLHTLHVCSNVQIDVVNETQAKGRCYFTFYSFNGPIPDSGLLPVTGPDKVGIYDDEFSLTADGWKISSRKVLIRFSVAT